MSYSQKVQDDYDGFEEDVDLESEYGFED